MKPSIDKFLKEEKGGAWLGPGIITGQQAWHMPRVNTWVRGHVRTDRHDEWPEVPTRRHAYKPAWRERKVMCGQPPSCHCSTENPIHTLHWLSHHYLSQQWHSSTSHVSMWLVQHVYILHTLLSAYTFLFVNLISNASEHNAAWLNMLMYVFGCEFGFVLYESRPLREISE